MSLDPKERLPYRSCGKVSAVFGWSTAGAATLVFFSFSGGLLSATLRVPSQFPDLQAAVDAAQSGDTVLVAPGDYASERAIEVTGKHLIIESVGGADVTVLRIVGVDKEWTSFTPVEGQRLSVLVFEGLEASGSRLWGFTLTGGYGTWVTPTAESEHTLHGNHASAGGGVLVLNAENVAIENCTLTRNTAAAGGGILCYAGGVSVHGCTFYYNLGGVDSANGAGGGACVTAKGVLVIRGSTFTRNLGGSGGGVSARNESVLLLEDSEINENGSDSGSGGGLAIAGSRATVKRCLFVGNELESGGGGAIACHNAPLLEIEACTVTENLGEGCAGGILVGVNSHVVVRDSHFNGNKATDHGNGGAIHVRDNGRLEVYRSVLDLNIADDGGCISVRDDGRAELHSCLITRNLGWESMAIEVRHRGYLELRNSTVANNPGSWSDEGAIFYFDTSRVRIESSIVWGHGRGSSEPVHEGMSTAAFEVSSSIVQGPSVLPGPGNSNADPRFVNVDLDFWHTGWKGDDDFRLRPDSPAVDAGSLDGSPDLDLDGNARPCLGSIDLGAYELGDCEPAKFRRGDSDGDGSLAVTDAVLTLEYLFRGSAALGCLDAADAEDDGSVSVTDAVYVLRHLFLGGPHPPGPRSECGVDATADELRCGAPPECKP